jgi:cellulase
MARCSASCSSLTPEQVGKLDFFKIDEAGWSPEGNGSVTKGVWAVDVMMRQNMTWMVTIPPSIAPGNYVLRFEIVALQIAAYGGAEVYPACINLQVKSTGADNPEGVKATEFYRDLEAPGLNLNLYMPFTEYVSFCDRIGRRELTKFNVEDSGTAAL